MRFPVKVFSNLIAGILVWQHFTDLKYISQFLVMLNVKLHRLKQIEKLNFKDLE